MSALEDVIEFTRIVRIKEYIVSGQCKALGSCPDRPGERRQGALRLCNGRHGSPRLGAEQALGQGLAIAIEDHRLCLQRLAAVKQHAARPSVAHHNSAAMCAIANAGTLGLRLLGQNLGQGMHAPANRPYASLFNMRNQHQGGGR